MKKRLFTWLKCFSMILVLSLLCVPLLTGAVAPAENVEVPAVEQAEELAPIEVISQPEIISAVKVGSYDNVELIPGAYSAEVYELVGFSSADAVKFTTASTKQLEEETFARLLYINRMQSWDYTLEEINITSATALKEAAVDYARYLTLADWQKKAMQDNVQFYLDTLHMSKEEKMDYYYRQQGFDGVAGYKAWQAEQNRISPEENARRLKADADAIRAEWDIRGIPHEHLSDEEIVNP